MSSNTTIVQDLQRAVTAFNNIETAINSSGLPNTPVEDYPQAIEDLKQGSGGNVQDIKNDTVNITTNGTSTKYVDPDFGYDSMGHVKLTVNTNVAGDCPVEISSQSAKIRHGFTDSNNNQRLNSLASAINLPFTSVSGQTVDIKAIDYSEAGSGFNRLLNNINAPSQDIIISTKESGSAVTATALYNMLNGAELNSVGFSKDGECAVTSTYGLLAGAHINYLGQGALPYQNKLVVAAKYTYDWDDNDHYVRTQKPGYVGDIGDSSTVITNDMSAAIPSFTLSTANADATGITLGDAPVELGRFGISSTAPCTLLLSGTFMSNIVKVRSQVNILANTKVYVESTGNGYTFGSDSTEADLVFDCTSLDNVMYSDMDSSKLNLFKASRILENTSGYKRELKFNSTAAAVTGFSDFKTAMEAKGYTITVG